MTEFGVLQPGHLRHSERRARERRARRRRRVRDAILAVAVCLVGLLAFMTSTLDNPAHVQSSRASLAPHAPTVRAPRHNLYRVTSNPRQVRVAFKHGPRAGLLFDVRSGRVLWEYDPTRELPIASLTKMMTALVVATHARPSARVMITRAAVHFSGSGVGLLPRGKRVPLLPLLYGLLLPSGNDAAIALAQHVAGTQGRFVSMMNAQARQMGLRCTRFDTVSGIVDRGNYSCAGDLAVIAHAVLEQRLLSRIVASRSAVFPFPIKGKKLYLYNNNPLMYVRYRGVDGIKTGYTNAAGPCLVASARRGRSWFAVVLLHSPNTTAEAERLLNAAFATQR